jgi:carbonic anhydrase
MHGSGGKMAHTVIPPAEALKLLIDGNQRWVDGQLEHPHQSVERRNEVAKHQDPFAVVFSCIDSRVPPEIVFDRGVGDLFVIRTGAQAVDDLVVLGSVEFGPNGYPSARLLLVLGHQGCGAITAAIESIQSGIPAPIHIRAVVDALRPAYDQAISQPGDDLVDKMVRAQVILTVQQLQNDSLLAPLVRSGELRVVGARYDLTTGRAEIIVDH